MTLEKTKYFLKEYGGMLAVLIILGILALPARSNYEKQISEFCNNYAWVPKDSALEEDFMIAHSNIPFYVRSKVLDKAVRDDLNILENKCK